MERSRKLALAATGILFISQFFQYGARGQTTMTMDLGINLISGGLPYGGESGWELHAWWFYAPLMALFAYLFYTSARPVFVYWLCLPVFVLTALGSGFGSILGGASILLHGYAVYKKIGEDAKGRHSISSKEAA